MTATPLLSRFTPSLMEPETLEAIFVQREALAQRIVESIRESVLTPAKHYSLIVGPRGIGKSHFVSLVYHRITAMEDLRDRLVVAWLREEEWGVTSFLDLLLRILRALRGRGPAVVREPEVEQLYELAPKGAERRAAKLLEETLGGRTLLVIVENLEDIFSGMKVEGQRKLRAHLQEHHSWTILATAQSLFGGVSLQTSPFYGFFRIVHLQQLDIDDAVRLLANIARTEGDEDLAAFITSPHGRARIRAIHHLAGGNPRVYVILSRFLDRTSLDALVQLFVQAMDDLTPYYQARMQWLSPQQRKIVEYLVDRRGAAPVKEIAQRSFITHQTASGQLKLLRDMGYVESQSVGRESYYELREPLMRFALEMKKQRAEPIRLFVEFLRVWYSRRELHDHLATLRAEQTTDRVYLESALRSLGESQVDPRIEACVRDYERHIEQEDWERALQVADELIVLRDTPDDHLAKIRCLDSLRRWNEALELIQPLLSHFGGVARLWLIIATLLHRLGRYTEALTAIDKAVFLAPEIGVSWYWYGTILMALDRPEQALAAAVRASELGVENKAIWVLRAHAALRSSRPDLAVPAFERLLVTEPEFAGHWLPMAESLAQIGRIEEALAAFEKALALSKENIDESRAAAHGRVQSLFLLGRWRDAIGAFLEVLDRFGDGGELFADALAVFLHHLIHAPHSDLDLAAVILQVARHYQRSGALATLSNGIVSTLRDVVAIDSERVASAWLSAWRAAIRIEQADGEATRVHPELELPMRLLETAVAFRQSGDPRVLLDLPIEERKVLEPLLGHSLRQESEGSKAAGH